MSWPPPPPAWGVWEVWGQKHSVWSPARCPGASKLAGTHSPVPDSYCCWSEGGHGETMHISLSACLEVCLAYIFIFIFFYCGSSRKIHGQISGMLKCMKGMQGNPLHSNTTVVSEWVSGWVLRPSVLPHLAAGLTLNHRLTHSRAEDTMTMKPHTHSQFTQRGREKQTEWVRVILNPF